MFHNKPKTTPVRQIQWQTTIRQALRHWLGFPGNTTSKLARETGLSRKTLTRFASNISDLQADSFQLLAEHLGFQLHRKAQ